MSTHKLGILTTTERDAMRDPNVQRAWETYRKDQSPAAKHSLRSALSRAGMQDPKKRDAMIDRLLKTRKFGNG